MVANWRQVESVGDWQIFARGDWPSAWITLKLLHTQALKMKRRHKKVFNLGWNGQRLAKSADSDVLFEHFPEMSADLIDRLQKLFPVKQEAP